MHDLKLAFRTLAKAPLVSAIAVASLALGVGANAAIFSIFERLILRPLPVEAPEHLVNLEDSGPKSGSMSSSSAGGSEAIFSYPMFRDLERAQTSFTGIAGHRSFGANLAYTGNTLSGEGMLVSGSYFSVLGIEPALGRLLGSADDTAPGAHPLAVLSHAYWTSRFGADPGVVGETLTVNGQPLTIAGVAPRGFEGTTLGDSPQVFVPISLRAQMVPGWNGFEERRNYWVYLFARLRPGIAIEQAQTALNVGYRGIIQEVELPLQQGASESYLERFAAKEIALEPGRRGQNDISEESKVPLLLLFGVTGLVLVIACANIANLLLTQAADRAGEIAIRMSIGARRFQLVRQLLAESFLLAALGGILGLLVAHATLRLIVSLLPSAEETKMTFELGPTTWVFLTALAVLTGLVGLFPALHATRTDLVTALKGPGARTSRSHTARRFRNAMATVQIALSMALLISAGLFTRSLLNVSRVDLGIETERLATFALSPDLNGYTPSAAHGLFERVETEVGSLPGVTSVAASMVPLLSGSNWGSNVSVEGFVAAPDADTNSMFNEIGAGYFRTLGRPLLSGREFEHGDTLGSPKVAIVNETFARKFDLGRDAVGKRMRVGSAAELDIEIVGLAQNAHYSDVKREVPAIFYLPYRQDDALGASSFYIRTEGDPGAVLPSVRAVLARLDPNLPVERLQTMTLQVRNNVFLDRMLTTISAAFALLATLLAAVGLYGVLAYAVAQRSREIGLRMALGADADRVRGLVLRHLGLMVVPGAILGVLAALGLGRLARSLLFELDAHDPQAFGAAVLLLLSVTFFAGFVPARRAARIDPMRALRNE